MDILKILNILEENSVFLSLDGEDLEISFEQDEIADNILDLLKENKQLLVDYLKKVQKQDVFQSIPNADVSESYELSSSQMRLWILSQFQEASLAYNMPFHIVLDSSYEVPVLKKAIDCVIERHEILRTVFKSNENGQIRQWIIPASEFSFEAEVVDYSQFPDAKSLADNAILEDSGKNFDLEKGPLLRAMFFIISPTETVFYCNMHHIISDGWSMEVLSTDVIRHYNVLKNNSGEKITPLAIQYKDYAAWQQNLLHSKKGEESKAYWSNILKNPISGFHFPSAYTRPVEKTFSGYRLKYYLQENEFKKLKDFSSQYSGSLFNTILAIWNLIFYKYTGNNECIIGTPYAGRFHTDLESQIGFYVNTIVLKNTINPEGNFVDFYKLVVKNTLEAINHQNYPFDALLDDIKLEKDFSRNPIFDVMVALQNSTDVAVDLSGQLGQIIDIGKSYSKFDFEINHYEEGNTLAIQFEYNTDIYQRETIEQLLHGFQFVLNTVLDNLDLNLTDVPVADRTMVFDKVMQFNSTEVSFDSKVTVVDLIEDQITSNSSSIALVYNEERYSYKELGILVNQFCHYLKDEQGVSSGELVGLQLDRSSAMVIAIVSTLKIGGCYVPLGMDYPEERVSRILNDSGIKKVIRQSEIAQFFENRSRYSEDFTHNIEPESSAYCIFTSGSTGVPKGVVNIHSGLYNRLLWMQSYLGSESNGIYFQKTPYTFDVSVWEFLLPLMCGGTLVVCAPEGHKDPEYLKQTIESEGISVIHFVPSMLGAFLEHMNKGDVSGLKHLICSGEELPSRMVEKVREKMPQVRIHNLYGPTEASIDVTALDVTDSDVSHGVTIGRPVWNTSIYIVDNKMNLLPAGIPGELLISGVQVAKGYLNLPELTNERFVADPFKEGSKIYRTGDVAYWKPDGTIQYMGRIDSQVKIRGNRIELGEVEKVLLEYDGIKQAVVSSKKVDNENVLVAYYLTEIGSEVDKVELRKYLRAKLPDYMQPDFYVLLKSIPMTSSGKVDRNALPDIIENDLIRRRYVAPKNETEEKLIILWKEVLGVEEIGVEDDFFELGGHSLKIIKLYELIKTNLSKDINVTHLFSMTTIRLQAQSINKYSANSIEEDNVSIVEIAF